MIGILLKAVTSCSIKVLSGDLTLNGKGSRGLISCCIITKGKTSHLENILSDLALQTMPRSSWEVVVVNHVPGDVEALCADFSNRMNVRYFLDKSDRPMLGALRNRSVEHAKGELILFLDDDTRILDPGFLSKAYILYCSSGADVIMPEGKASYGLVKEKYAYLDPFSFATRCILYKREFISKLGGFRSFLHCYDDIDLGIRALIRGAKIVRTKEICYSHPPLFFADMRKPLAIGQSLWTLRKHCPSFLWIIIYLNSLRFLICILLPTRRNMQWFKISLGVLIAPFIKERRCY